MPAESNPAVLAPIAAARPDDVTAARQRAWVDVDLAALRRNAACIARHAGVPILPMVKAEAYGVGAVAVARALESFDPYGFGIATVAEGEALRAAGIARRLVLFSPLLPRELPRARAAGLTPSLHRVDDVVAWAALGGGAWQLSIDTGMCRAGVRWDAVEALIDVVRAHPPEGAYTHLHSAESDEASRHAQEARFEAALARLPARPAVLHAENSPGTERGGGRSRWDVVRPGVFLYGVDAGETLPVEPVAHLRARVIDVRDVAAGETVSYGATWTAKRDRTDRHGRGGVRGRLSAVAVQPRRRAAAWPARSGRRRRDDGHDHAGRRRRAVRGRRRRDAARVGRHADPHGVRRRRAGRAVAVRAVDRTPAARAAPLSRLVTAPLSHSA